MPVMRQEAQNFASPEFKSDSPKALSTIVDCFKPKRVPLTVQDDAGPRQQRNRKPEGA
ncbi:hypothetical protein FOTG_13342 [Fusarium oxysporum f. sp. vasinfectum 25433]|uniref:Uncharacterized protein n=1 Tax=Fusarium oxysporum f. sp. vasinfectum 25433 TaxID=1089449 RepID=X0KYF6_FUSOX|nr:hypothetical protein FOTG_13342 [Fusarium oxysporum f. sp. vasinfectum 25433]